MGNRFLFRLFTAEGAENAAVFAKDSASSADSAAKNLLACFYQGVLAIG